MSSTSRHHPDHQAPAIVVLSSQAAQQHPRWGLAGSLWPHRLLSNVHAGRIHRPTGPSLTRRVCQRKKREREKREAVSGPAGPAGCPSRTRPRAEGGPGVALGGQGRQKTLHPPGSLHSSPNQKLHLSICSNLNGPDRAPCSPSLPPRRPLPAPVRRCDSSRCSGCSTSWGDPRLVIACPRGTVKQLHCPAAPKWRPRCCRCCHWQS